MNNENPIDLNQFPDLLGAVMSLGEDTPFDQSAIEEGDGIMERPLLPLRGMVLYPHMVTPLFVGRDKSLAALQAAIANGESMVVAAQKNAETGEPTEKDIYSVGTEVTLGRSIKLPDNSNSVLCQGQRRIEILEFVQWEPYIRVRFRPIIEPEQEWGSDIEALMRAVLDLYEKAVSLDRKLPEDALTFAMNANDPGWLADFVVSTLEIHLEIKQSLLENLSGSERLRRVHLILAQEVDLLETETRIQHKVQQEIDRNQREHFLREQMRAIQGELGEGDIFSQELNELTETVANAKLPKEVRAKVEKELARLASMPPMSPELGMIRNYLDWVLGVPWQNSSDDNLDVKNAAAVLDEDHYALDKVKDRILEYIAVKQLAAGKMRTPILCFVGPPGTGKTSLGKSIARALNREFTRMSLGGMRDEAEIRGHRRTYIGALPGRMVQSLRKVGTNNPIFMLDEIDKVGQDFRGDPSSALLEVLDPEQNNAFRDHYLELDLDLSKAMFITTANQLGPIPAPLRDRMEIIEFDGYLEEEKIEIARQFVIPRQLENHGIANQRIKFDDEALQSLIRHYTYEAGVRNLEREVANVCRKVARKVAEGSRVPRRITPKRITELLGPPKYIKEGLRDRDEVGIATGLAWTSVGGAIMPIEVNLMPGKGNMQLTGKLGDVMQESAKAALTFVRSRSEQLAIAPSTFENTDIHLHVPEGAVPKDGPSAGVAMTMALISAFTNRPIKRSVAMTGEITLRGRVLAVGGVREKALAARRAGIKTVIIPAKNQSELQKIPKRLRDDLKFIQANHVDDVLDIVLTSPVSL